MRHHGLDLSGLVRWRLALCLILCSAGLVALWSPSAWSSTGQARPSEWVGATRCIGCHEAERKAWQRGPHATAAESLGERAGDGRCESCHGTGAAPAGRNTLRNVQCEACHGPGQHYISDDIMRDAVLARVLGLRDLATPAQRAALCRRCHDASTSIVPFDVEKAWLRIAH